MARRFNVEIFIDVEKTGKSASKGAASVSRLGDSAKRTEDKLKRLKSVSIGLAKSFGLVGTAAVVMFAKRSIAAAGEQEEALALVANGVKNLGAGFGLTTQQVADYASELQGATKRGDEAILRSSAILTSFRNISGETFKRTQALVLDVAEVMQTDLKSAAVQLGKALDDPAKNLSQLTRAGITFSKEQIELVKHLQETNRLGEAQAVVLKEIEGQYGGAAAAARDTLTGALAALGNQWGDLLEKFAMEAGGGGMLRTAIEGWVDLLAWANENFAKLAGGIKAGWNTILVTVVTVLENMTGAVAKFFEVVDSVFGAGGGVADALRDTQKTLGALAEVAKDDLVDALIQIERGAPQTTRELKGLQTQLDNTTESTVKTATAMDILDAKLADVNAIIKDLEKNLELEESMEGLGEQMNEAFESTLDDLLGDSLEGSFEQAMEDILPAIEKETEKIAESMTDEGPWKKGFDVLKKNWMGALAGALTTALSSGDVSAAVQQLGAGLGQMLGTAMGGPLGGVLGGILGSLAGKVLGDLVKGGPANTGTTTLGAGGVSGTTGEAGDIAEQVQSFMDSLEEIVGGTITALQDLAITIRDDGSVMVTAINEFGEGISTLTFASVEEALEHIKQQLIAAVEFDEGHPLSQAFIEILDQAGQIGSEAVMENLETLKGIYESVTGTIEGQAARIRKELSAFDTMRKEIEALGLSAEATAMALSKVTEAEKIRRTELQGGFMDRFAQVLQRAGIQSQAFAEKRAKIEQAIFRINIAKLEAEARMLGLWDKAMKALFNQVRQFAEDVGNFASSVGGGIGGVGDIGAGIGKVGGGGRGRRGGRKQKRKSLLEQLNSFFDSGKTDSLNSRLEKLKNQFFGPKGFMAQAKKLKVPIEKVTAAFRAAVKALREEALTGIRDFLGRLRSGGFGGATLGDQFSRAKANYERILRKAQSGDLDAINQLPGAAGEFLELARQMFGGSSAMFQDILGTVEAAMQNILEGDQAALDDSAQKHAEAINAMQAHKERTNHWGDKQFRKLRDANAQADERKDILISIRDELSRMGQPV